MISGVLNASREQRRMMELQSTGLQQATNMVDKLAAALDSLRSANEHLLERLDVSNDRITKLVDLAFRMDQTLSMLGSQLSINDESSHTTIMTTKTTIGTTAITML